VRYFTDSAVELLLLLLLAGLWGKRGRRKGGEKRGKGSYLGGEGGRSYQVPFKQQISLKPGAENALLWWLDQDPLCVVRMAVITTKSLCITLLC
jgi:hypothetical protein